MRIGAWGRRSGRWCPESGVAGCHLSGPTAELLRDGMGEVSGQKRPRQIPFLDATSQSRGGSGQPMWAQPFFPRFFESLAPLKPFSLPSSPGSLAGGSYLAREEAGVQREHSSV